MRRMGRRKGTVGGAREPWSWARRAVFFLLVIALLGLAPPWAAAQFGDGLPEIPSDFVSGRRQLRGNKLVFCVYAEGLNAEFHAAVARSIAEALLLEAEIYPVRAMISVPFSYQIPIGFDELFIYLSDHCDAFMGITHAAEAYPEWMVLSRAYFAGSFVLAVTDGAIRDLNGVPAGRPIGTVSGSLGDVRFAQYLAASGGRPRWPRYPYPHHERLLERLRDGTVVAAIVYEPALYAMTGGDPEGQGIFVRPLRPMLPTQLQFGVALRSRDTFLRAQIDEAIKVLVEDGIIGELLQEHGIPGHPGEPA